MNVLVLIPFLSAAPQAQESTPPAEVIAEARRNAELAAEALRRCRRYAAAWLALADPETGLIPTNTRPGGDHWSAANSAADNYPFLVLTAAVTGDEQLLERLRAMLDIERRLTTRAHGLPDDWSFPRQAFRHDEPDLHRMQFGASEYVKDGLLPLTEWLGPSPWADRMVDLVDAVWESADLEISLRAIPTGSEEVHGEMLQVLSRLYWMTGERKYLDWAVRLGDHYLRGASFVPDDRPLRLRDHGCEIVSGLCELYVTLHFADPGMKEEYREPLHALLDRILEVGRNEDGLFADEVHLGTGARRMFGAGARATDTYGYTLNGYYAVYLVDGTEAYREAVREALSALWRGYRSHPWEGSSADGYADAIESALNLHQREPIESCARWLDSEILVMWGKQRESGIVEGWHGDGNFARTSLMYALWKTQGVTARPWREDLRLGAVRDGEDLVLAISATVPWRGQLVFDHPRHVDFLHAPLDWPRINQFPEWFVVRDTRAYRYRWGDGPWESAGGHQLTNGLPVQLPAGETRSLVISPAP